MISLLYFQVPIFLLLFIGAYTDYKTRTVSNNIIIGIAIFSLPMIWIQTSFLIPILLCGLFLGLFYFTNQIGGADTKVFIVLLLGMSTNDIFIFFLLFSFANLFLLIKFWKGIPLFISILFGYFGVLFLSALSILIHMTFDS